MLPIVDVATREASGVEAVPLAHSVTAAVPLSPNLLPINFGDKYTKYYFYSNKKTSNYKKYFVKFSGASPSRPLRQANKY